MPLWALALLGVVERTLVIWVWWGVVVYLLNLLGFYAYVDKRLAFVWFLLFQIADVYMNPWVFRALTIDRSKRILLGFNLYWNFSSNALLSFHKDPDYNNKWAHQYTYKVPVELLWLENIGFYKYTKMFSAIQNNLLHIQYETSIGTIEWTHAGFVIVMMVLFCLLF